MVVNCDSTIQRGGDEWFRFTVFIATCDVNVCTCGSDGKVIHVEELERVRIGCRDSKQIVGLSHHPHGFDDIVECLDCALELRNDRV